MSKLYLHTLIILPNLLTSVSYILITFLQGHTPPIPTCLQIQIYAPQQSLLPTNAHQYSIYDNIISNAIKIVCLWAATNTH